MANRKKGPSSISKKTSPNVVKVTAAGVPIPVAPQHQGAVKAGAVGGVLGMALMSFTGLGLPAIIVAGAVGLTGGALIGNEQDEKRKTKA